MNFCLSSILDPIFISFCLVNYTHIIHILYTPYKKTKRRVVSDPIKNINNAADLSSVQQTEVDTIMPVLLEEETKFKDLSQQADVGDLNQDLMIQGEHHGQRHYRFSNKKGRSRVVANTWRMRRNMLDESSSAKPTSSVKTNNAFDMRSLQSQLAEDLSIPLSMSMDNLDMEGIQTSSGGGGTYSKSSKSKSSKGRSKCSKKKTIECENGFTTSVGGKTIQNTTCTEACNGKCCDDGEGGDPCSGLSADICMDGITCSGGKQACVDTTATSIFKGCSNSDFACKFAGGEGGNLGKIIRSCNNGRSNCIFTAQSGGTIPLIQDSCNNSTEVCKGAAASNGNINEGIISSCNYGRATCKSFSDSGGTINGGVFNSCNNGELACYSAARQNTINGGIIDSCNGLTACRSLVSLQGMPQPVLAGVNGNIIHSCNGDKACDGVAANFGGNINGGIIDSCNAYSACQNVAFNGGLVNGTIEGSCNNITACDRAGSACLYCPGKSEFVFCCVLWCVKYEDSTIRMKTRPFEYFI